MRIAIVHYAYVPVIGGVEFVMAQHAALFTRHGYEVRVVCGEGISRDPEIECVVIPELLPNAPASPDSQKEALAPEDSERPAFNLLKKQIKASLRDAIEDCGVVIVHNMMTMHFNLAATAALRELSEERLPTTRWINWVHDIAAADPNYPEAHAGHYPVNLLAESHHDMAPVAISEKRQRQFCKLTHTHVTDCPVVPNGIEFLRLLKLTKNIRKLARTLGILFRDVVIIHPARILHRKNIEFGIRTIAALKASGKSCLYLVTGAPDPHNEAAQAYGKELRTLIKDLGVEDVFHFVTERFKVSDRDLISLYSVSDVLFLPSRQEGFGLPLLEAGLFRLPVFCTRIEPLTSILENNVHFFDLDADPAAIAAEILETLDGSPGYRARKEVMTSYSWDVVFNDKIRPLFPAP